MFSFSFFAKDRLSRAEVLSVTLCADKKLRLSVRCRISKIKSKIITFCLKLNYNSSLFFRELNKKSWNRLEMGLNFGNGMAFSHLYLAKGIYNKRVLNSGIGTGILTIDRINFIPIFINSSYDIFPSNSLEVSRYKFFTYNNIGYSFAEDFRNDYISVEGGLYWSIGLGIKKSLRRTNISLKGGYLLQKYKSEHNLWWWDMIFFDPNQNY